MGSLGRPLQQSAPGDQAPVADPGDGIQEFVGSGGPSTRGSELRSPQQAPENGYQSKLVKLSAWHPNRPATNNYDSLHLNYIFRVKTVLDGNGKVQSANSAIKNG